MRNAVVLLLLVLCTPARAGAPAGAAALAQAKELYEHAQAEYDLTNYESALAGFEKAYEMKPLPGLLFNIGQCHRQLHHWDKALYFFHTYLEKLPTAKNRALVESLITEVEGAQKEEQQKHEEASKAPPPPPLNPAAAAAVTVGATTGASGTQQGTTPAKVPVYRRWYFWVGVGAGVLLAGTAVGLGVGLSHESVTFPMSTQGTIDAR